MKLKDFPKELTEGRESIEATFIFCLFKNPELYGDYLHLNEGNDETIKTEDGIFYFSLGKQLYLKGLHSFDHVSIYSFLENKPNLKSHFDELGGYKTVKELKSLVDADNVSAYYDSLCKMNMLMCLYEKGFNIMSNLDKFSQMTTQDVYDWYDYMLNNISVGKIEHLKAENLSDGYDKYIDEWDKGLDVGFRVGSPMLNYMLSGVHKENLMLHMGGIGQGKTTTAVALYILPAIESGEDVCIIANEQSASQFRQIILATVLFNKIKYMHMNRQKLIIGNFTEEQREKLKEAEAWLQAQEGKITFVEMQNYSITNVKKTVKKFSKLGVGLFIFDTLKPESDASERSWGEFSEVAKELFILAKSEKVAIIATAQLSSESIYRKFLNLSCVGKSRAIAETASTVVMFRPLSKDEKENIQAWRFEKDESGAYKKTRRIMELDPEKDYIMVFVPKNRYGQVDPQIIMERNMSFNTLKDIGYYECPIDVFRNK